MRPDGAIEIIDLLDDTDRDVVIRNGHLESDDTFAILDEIEARGADVLYLLTHADSSFMHLSVENQVELTDGGTYIERGYISVTKEYTTLETVVESIANIRPEQSILSADHEQPDDPSPSEAYASYLNDSERVGISQRELQTMVSNVPRQVLGNPV